MTKNIIHKATHGQDLISYDSQNPNTQSNIAINTICLKRLKVLTSLLELQLDWIVRYVNVGRRAPTGHSSGLASHTATPQL